MAPTDFLDRLQARTATLAIDRSTLRNQGAAGMVAAARQYFAKSQLSLFRTRSRRQFEKALDEHTRRLMRSFPHGGRKNWGAARKALNIFLRDVVYNRPLCEHHRLANIESWLELPLDSYAHAGLVKDAGDQALPRWPGVKHLTPGVSSELQAAASAIARRRGTLRVHLDVIYWRPEELERLRNRN